MNEKLNKALNQISDKHIDEAAKAKIHRRPYWTGAVAAALALVIALCAIFGGTTVPDAGNTNPVIQGTEPGEVPKSAVPQSPTLLGLINMVSAAEYPTMAPLPSYEDYVSDPAAYDQAYSAWLVSQGTQYNQPKGYADSLVDFFAASISEFLSGEENQAYSPLNVYMALAMLAETTDGNSRQQILDLLGASSIEDLRQQADYVWNAHYSADSQTATVLGNSLWLDDGYDFHQDTADLLAERYYASVFHGDLGSDDLNRQLQTWLDSQTGGLLTEQAGNVRMSDDTAFALASTIYFSAGWEDAFSENRNTQEIFHCDDKELRTEFMNRTISDSTYYCGSNFGAVRLEMTGANAMWLILPDEGVTVDEVLESGEYLQMTLNPAGWKDKFSCKLNLSLPKFDVSSQMDLVSGMKKLGITDIFNDSVSDFSPLTDADGLFVGKIDHAARVVIDEEGCVAAAFTVMLMYGTGMPMDPPEEIDFVLDRPFLFVVSSRDDLPLFAGTVTEP